MAVSTRDIPPNTAPTAGQTRRRRAGVEADQRGMPSTVLAARTRGHPPRGRTRGRRVPPGGGRRSVRRDGRAGQTPVPTVPAMTSDLMTPSAPTAIERPARSAGSLMLPIAGAAMIAGPLLYVAGMATSPTADSMAPADYIASLARDPGQTAISALLLHYGNLALGLAWLAVPSLVRG